MVCSQLRLRVFLVVYCSTRIYLFDLPWINDKYNIIYGDTCLCYICGQNLQDKGGSADEITDGTFVICNMYTSKTWSRNLFVMVDNIVYTQENLQRR